MAAIGSSAQRSSSTHSARASAVVRRRVVVAILTVLSLALVTVYFRESDGGFLHDVQSTGASVLRPVRGRRRARRAPVPRRRRAGSAALLAREIREQEAPQGARRGSAQQAILNQSAAARERPAEGDSSATSTARASRRTTAPVTTRVIGRARPAVRPADRRLGAGKNNGISKHDARRQRGGPRRRGDEGGVATSRSSRCSPTRRARSPPSTSRPTRPASPSRGSSGLADRRPGDQGPGREPGRRARHRRLALGRPLLALPARDPGLHGHARSASPTSTSTSRSSATRSSTSRRSRP